MTNLPPWRYTIWATTPYLFGSRLKYPLLWLEKHFLWPNQRNADTFNTQKNSKQLVSAKLGICKRVFRTCRYTRKRSSILFNSVLQGYLFFRLDLSHTKRAPLTHQKVCKRPQTSRNCSVFGVKRLTFSPGPFLKRRLWVWGSLHHCVTAHFVCPILSNRRKSSAFWGTKKSPQKNLSTSIYQK